MSRFETPKNELRTQRFITLAWLLSGVFILYIGSFILFTENLSDDAGFVPEADGIVVFTGGTTERIHAGLRLLADKKGKRLLVTGLYENQTFDSILAIARRSTDDIRCCLDLDYKAENTVANSRETALWADAHGFRSLIVVTSTQHMPRAFLELRRAMPTAHLSAYPIVPPQVKLEHWFAFPGTMALLLGEYTRYLWALTGLPSAG